MLWNQRATTSHSELVAIKNTLEALVGKDSMLQDKEGDIEDKSKDNLKEGDIEGKSKDNLKDHSSRNDEELQNINENKGIKAGSPQIDYSSMKKRGKHTRRILKFSRGN